MSSSLTVYVCVTIFCEQREEKIDGKENCGRVCQ